jgi:hypothetical protein
MMVTSDHLSTVFVRGETPYIDSSRIPQLRHRSTTTLHTKTHYQTPVCLLPHVGHSIYTILPPSSCLAVPPAASATAEARGASVSFLPFNLSSLVTPSRLARPVEGRLPADGKVWYASFSPRSPSSSDLYQEVANVRGRIATPLTKGHCTRRDNSSVK